MQKMKSLIWLLALTVTSFVVTAQSTNLALGPVTSNATYNDLPIGQLNVAERQVLAGRFEDALLTYEGALAWQANWIPALAARAELYHRMGRHNEADRDLDRARRVNPRATAFLMAKGESALLPYLAIYPQKWFENQYAFLALGPSLGGGSDADNFYLEQHATITNSLDTTTASIRALRQKIDNDLPGAYRSLQELPRDYPGAVSNMLTGNIAMLNHRYSQAINYYSAALRTARDVYPEIYYNRGLAQIKLTNYVGGCDDLRRAARDDFAPAVAMFDTLCSQ